MIPSISIYVLSFLIFFLIFTVTPMIWIQNQLVGAQEGQQMTLECHSEAYPKSINYWTRENNVIITNGMLINIK